jgi:16S rRNA (cytidine1402-2'-O)-methyltransferase
MGILYIVPTPIGNLDDITLRAIKVLRDVSLIAAEDTRRAAILLSHFDLHTPVTSYFEHNKLSKLNRILGALEQGDVALISEAGTRAYRSRLCFIQRRSSAGAIVPLPGATAAIRRSGFRPLADSLSLSVFSPAKRAIATACWRR